MRIALNAAAPSVQNANAGITGPDHEARTTWIHVAPFGEWSGHSSGRFSLTQDSFSAVCAQVSTQSTPVSVDYEHASIRPKGDPTPAAGYVLATEVRADGLFALTEFTQRAADMIKAGEYRFCSGVFDFTRVDPRSGDPLPCVLDTIALTNRPFIDGQHPIVLSKLVPLTAGATMQEIDLKALAKLLDAIPGPNTADKIKKALDLMASGQEPEKSPPAADKADASKPTDKVVALTEPAPAVALGDAAPPVAPAAAMADAPPAGPDMPLESDMDNDEAVDDFDQKMMADLGLTDPDAYAALLVANYDAIKSLLVGGGDAGAVAMSRDLAVKGLASQLELITRERNRLLSEKAEAALAACTAEVDELIKRSPTLAGERESMIALAKTAPKEFRRVASVLAPKTAPLTQPHAVALAQPTGAPAQIIAEDHPRLVAQRASLAHAGIRGEAAERVLATVRKQLESAG